MPSVLERRAGIPLSLAVLWLGLADRVGLGGCLVRQPPRRAAPRAVNTTA
jgi:regulator of sirC expression with transglutaminase-like and TPR domain